MDTKEKLEKNVSEIVVSLNITRPLTSMAGMYSTFHKKTQFLLNILC